MIDFCLRKLQEESEKDIEKNIYENSMFHPGRLLLQMLHQVPEKSLFLK